VRGLNRHALRRGDDAHERKVPRAAFFEHRDRGGTGMSGGSQMS
jgi:hypothetical protein